jgi:toxin ParE1/3/4
LGQVSFTDEAREDLLAIEDFLAERSPRVADSFIDSVLERCRQLEQFPELGPVRHDVHPDARCLVHQRWLILYRLVPGGVEVVRVADGAGDLSSLFWPEERP